VFSSRPISSSCPLYHVYSFWLLPLVSPFCCKRIVMSKGKPKGKSGGNGGEFSAGKKPATAEEKKEKKRLKRMRKKQRQATPIAASEDAAGENGGSAPETEKDADGEGDKEVTAAPLEENAAGPAEPGPAEGDTSVSSSPLIPVSRECCMPSLCTHIPHQH
jgi:hypothetical protein